MQLMPFHQAHNLLNDALDLLWIEAPVVENRIGTVIARIGTTYACGIGQLAVATHTRIGIEVHPVIGWRRKGGKRRSGPVRVREYLPVPLEPAAGNHVQARSRAETIKHLDEGLLALASHHDVDKLFAHCLCG